MRCLLHTQPPGGAVESAGLSLDAYRHSDGTQRDPSARTAGDFRQSLAFLHVSHLPLLYILVLEVGYLLHTRPSGVLGVSEGHSSDAYRHSDSTQCLNCRGFPSVTGISACLMYVKTIAKEHPKYNSKQPKYTRSIAEVYPRCSRSTAEHYGRRTRPKYSQSVYCKCTLAIGALVEIPLKYIQSISEV